MKLEAIILGLSNLKEVIIKGLLWDSYFICCWFKSVQSFSFVVNLFIELAPVIHILHGLPNCPFFDFFHWLSWWVDIGDFLFVFSIVASESDFDDVIEEEFILERDYLFEGELSDVNVNFSGVIEVEEMAVVEVEAWLEKGDTLGADGKDGMRYIDLSWVG